MKILNFNELNSLAASFIKDFDLKLPYLQTHRMMKSFSNPTAHIHRFLLISPRRIGQSNQKVTA